jgi:hypothetical protein
MNMNKLMLVGLGAIGMLGLGRIAVAAPPSNEIAEILRGILTVQVVNTDPLPVKPVVPKEEPIMLEFGSDTPNYVVPEGKLLVIQAVSFDVNADELPNIEHPPQGTVSIATFDRPNFDIKFFFFAIDHRTSGFDKWVMSTQTTMYAVAGKEVSADFTPFASGGRATIAGVLRDAP